LIYDIFYRHADFGDAIDSSINVSSGQTFSGVEIVLRETVTGATASQLGLANLNAYAVNVGSSGSNGSFNTLTLSTAGGFAAGSNDADTLNYAALGAGLGQPGRSSTALGGGQRLAVLGTVNLVAPTVGSTTFTLADFNPSVDGDFTTFATGASGLESISAASGPSGGLFGRSLELNVSAVPEPSSMALVGLAASLYASRRVLRRKLASAGS
jgi:hypothetical protein